MKLKRKLELKEAPHWFHSNSSKTLIWKAALSLLPIVGLFVFFDFKTMLGNWLLSLAAGFGFEYASRKLFGSKPLYSDGDIFYIGTTLALLLPKPVDVAAVLNAAFFSFVIGRFAFGGRGEAVFHAIPLGILGFGLWPVDTNTQNLLSSHASWPVLLAMAASAALFFHTKILDWRMALIFSVTSILTILISGRSLSLLQLTILMYVSVWVLSDSAKPMSQPGRVLFSGFSGVLSGLFYLKLNLIDAAAASLLCANLFLAQADKFFLPRRTSS